MRELLAADVVAAVVVDTADVGDINCVAAVVVNLLHEHELRLQRGDGEREEDLVDMEKVLGGVVWGLLVVKVVAKVMIHGVLPHLKVAQQKF